MGEAFGKAMIGLIGDSPAVDHSGQVKKAYEGSLTNTATSSCRIGETDAG